MQKRTPHAGWRADWRRVSDTELLHESGLRVQIRRDATGADLVPDEASQALWIAARSAAGADLAEITERLMALLHEAAAIAQEQPAASLVSDVGALIHLRVPAATKAAWVRASRAEGLRLTDYVVRAVEQWRRGGGQ